MEDTVELARELARIARENDLAVVEYRSADGHKIKLIREEPAPAPVLGAPAYYAPPPPQLAAPAPAAAAAPAPAAPVAAAPTINALVAGVFYRAPRPGAPPFVEVGQTVSVGQTLCILEAMKMMNNQDAEIPCRIRKVLVENGQVVEVGQPLFEIEPLG